MINSSRTYLKWFIFFAFLLILANEVGRIGITYYNSSSLADKIAQEAINAYFKHRSLAAARYTAEKVAQENGVVFGGFNFQESPPKMFINIIVPVEGTWIIHRFEITKPYTTLSLQGEAEPSY